MTWESEKSKIKDQQSLAPGEGSLPGYQMVAFSLGPCIGAEDESDKEEIEQKRSGYVFFLFFLMVANPTKLVLHHSELI